MDYLSNVALILILIINMLQYIKINYEIQERDNPL